MNSSSWVALTLLASLFVVTFAQQSLLWSNDDDQGCINTHLSGPGCSASRPCCDGYCCSKFGWCGSTRSHCSKQEGCVSGCWGSSGSSSGSTGGGSSSGGSTSGGSSSGSTGGGSSSGGSSGSSLPSSCSGAISREAFQCAFGSKLSSTKLKDFYCALNKVAPRFGFSESSSKIEVAAFFAQIAHESDFLTAMVEYCARAGSCVSHYDHPSWCPNVRPKSGKHYYGRGVIQLSWPCNYHSIGQYIGEDLLSNPDLVANNLEIAWKTGLAFWKINQCDSYARSGKFGATTRKINGALECGRYSPQNQRVEYYQRMRRCFGLGDERDTSKLTC